MPDPTRQSHGAWHFFPLSGTLHVLGWSTERKYLQISKQKDSNKLNSMKKTTQMAKALASIPEWYILRSMRED
jgi:hypothetical protein